MPDFLSLALFLISNILVKRKNHCLHTFYPVPSHSEP